ncbi:transglycosylase-like protein with SLT domain [Actinocorallia herbida]|uniref:Transglycosylase-like protein with SLT domain n=1 Tax=Actinocorallia herbida TaxID=58109 RepID=A0A3N1CN19_9ACTN|nr:transglycosylase family protein [Actinocorallia herbida]ROO82702.1 transglycosylase-like protein with SLT domain [Actinocorallia herbida]
MPLIATVLLVGVAAGGWNLFSEEPQSAPIALVGDRVKLPSQKDVRSPDSPSGTGGGAPTAPRFDAPVLPPLGSLPPGEAAGEEAGAAPRVAEAPRPEAVEKQDTGGGGGGPLNLLNLPKLLPKEATQLNLLNLPVTDLNWGAVARCESNNDPELITTSKLYGLYQFSREAWESVGGTGLPVHASAEEQTLRAQMLFEKQNGWTTTCGDMLYAKN